MRAWHYAHDRASLSMHVIPMTKALYPQLPCISVHFHNKRQYYDTARQIR